MAFATGSDDADLKVQLAGADGTITPAGSESLHIKSQMTATLELADITKGQAGSLILTPAEGGRAAPVVAALRVVRGKGDKREIAFIPATAPIASRSTVADNRAKGSTLSLTAPGATAKVKVTASAGTGGGEPAEKTYTVKGGTTLAVTPPVPAGLKGSYALTVEPEPGGGPVHAARTLALPEDGVPMFTVQTLPDDRGTVSVPKAKEDLSILDDGNWCASRQCLPRRANIAGRGTRLRRGCPLSFLPVPGIDGLGRQPQQFRDLLDHDLVHQQRAVVAVLGTDLHGPPVDQDPRRVVLAGRDRAAERHGVVLRGRHLHDHEIHLGQLGPAPLQPVHGVPHEIAEGLGAAGRERHLGRGDGPTHTAAVTVAAARPWFGRAGRYRTVHH